jgi:hypothetical protein
VRVKKRGCSPPTSVSVSATPSRLSEHKAPRPKDLAEHKSHRPRTQEAAYARIVDRVRHVIRGHKKILAGPWVGEIGYELLYWIPFLRWLSIEIPGFTKRLTVCSRGGVASWYADLTSEYIELFDLMDPSQIAQERVVDGWQTGRLGGRSGMLRRFSPVGKKDHSSPVYEELTRRAIERMRTDDVGVLTSSLLYRLVRQTDLPQDVYKTVLEPAPISPPETSIELPERFAAVRFYDGAGTPRKVDGLVKTISRVCQSLGEHMPVISMNPGIELDTRHREIEVPGATRLPTLAPETNLRELTAVMARATIFVGSYGGFSYIAPHLGVPTFTVFAQRPEDAPGDAPTHLAMARRLFASPRFGDYLVITPAFAEQAELLQVVLGALGREQASG